MKFLTLDFETSGLNAQYDYILQVGAAVMDDEGNVEQTFSRRITPPAKLKVSLEAIAVQMGDVTPDTLKTWYSRLVNDSGSSRDVFLEFQAWVKEHEAGSMPVVAWNAAFDHGFWGQWMFAQKAVANGSVISPTWICAMAEAQNRPLGVRTYGLDMVARAVGAGERPKAHDALIDAVLAGTVYGRLLRGIYSAEQVTA